MTLIIIGLNGILKKKKWMYFEMEKIYNKIYIPEGSIIDEFSIDLN